MVTALPHAFYPESSWRDDLAWGAAELALAGQALDDPRADTWLASGAHWATEYLATEAGEDTLNLYDTSAIAMADLVRAIRASSDATVGHHGAGTSWTASGPSSTVPWRGRPRIPFGAGVEYAGFDAAPHVFGLIATARLYRLLTGDDRYDAFTAQQRDWAIRREPVGRVAHDRRRARRSRCVLSTWSRTCRVARTGAAPILRGAVVNGPNCADLFADGLDEFFDEGHACPTDGKDRYAAFTGHGSRFVDDVSAWQTVEPALDFSGIAGYALALTR